MEKRPRHIEDVIGSDHAGQSDRQTETVRQTDSWTGREAVPGAPDEPVSPVAG